MTPVKEYKILCSIKEVDKNHLWMRPFLDRDGYDILFWGDKGWTPLFFHNHHHLKHKLDHFFHDEHKDAHPISLELDDILECLCEKIKELERKLQNNGCDCKDYDEEIAELRMEIQRLKENQNDSSGCDCDLSSINEKIKEIENKLNQSSGTSGETYPIDAIVYEHNENIPKVYSNINHEEKKYDLQIGLPIRHTVSYDTFDKRIDYGNFIIYVINLYKDKSFLSQINNIKTRIFLLESYPYLGKSSTEYKDNLGKYIYLFFSDNCYEFYKRDDGSLYEGLPFINTTLRRLNFYEDFRIDYLDFNKHLYIDLLKLSEINMLIGHKVIFSAGSDFLKDKKIENNYVCFDSYEVKPNENDFFVRIYEDFVESDLEPTVYLSETGKEALSKGDFYIKYDLHGYLNKERVGESNDSLKRFLLKIYNTSFVIKKIKFEGTRDYEFDVNIKAEPFDGSIFEFAPYQITYYSREAEQHTNKHDHMIPIVSSIESLYENWDDIINAESVSIYFQSDVPPDNISIDNFKIVSGTFYNYNSIVNLLDKGHRDVEFK